MSDQSEHQWQKYYEATHARPPLPLLVKAVALRGVPGRALDLGCGAGRNVRYLLEQGYTVTAVDMDPHAAAFIHALPHQERVRFVQSSYEDFQPERYELVSAQASLPFNPRRSFDVVLAKFKRAVVPNGLFCGHLFGVHDEWHTPERDMTFHTRAEAEALFADMELIEFVEKEWDGPTATGTHKHWHGFEIIARQRRETSHEENT